MLFEPGRFWEVENHAGLWDRPRTTEELEPKLGPEQDAN